MPAATDPSLLVDGIRDSAVFLLDPAGAVASWNPGAQRIVKYSAEEIIGRPFSTFDAGEPAAAAELAQAARAGSVESEGWRTRRDGERFWALTAVSALQRGDGAPAGFAVVMHDRTLHHAEDERLRASEQRLRVLIDSVRDYAIFSLDADGRVASWNAGAEQIKGYRANEIIGQSGERFYTPDAAHRFSELLKIARTEGRVEDEGWRLRKDGTRFWANVILTAVRDPSGRLIGFAKVTRDLTERLRAEDERVRLAKAEEAIRVRDEFLSIAAHELRTPLATLQLQLGSLARRMSVIDEKLANRVDRAERSSARLGELVEALLDVSRFASGRVELARAEVDLREIVEEVVERFREPALRASSMLKVVDGEPLRGLWDRLRLEQVLTNLIGNALKYAAGRPIEVKTVRNGDSAELQVRDHGPGVETANLERIFGRFERASSLRHYGGLGLGLYVSREIVQAHGGTIVAENCVDGGARFVVRLPLGLQEQKGALH